MDFRGLCFNKVNVRHMSKHALCLVFTVFSAVTASYASDIKVTQGKYSDYYHMRFELVSGQYSLNLAYGFNEGGQFEVLIPKGTFSIPAPHCKGDLIIRMPYSEQVAEKKLLFEQLQSDQSVNVTLELNPYVTVLKSSPLQLELQGCNLFFRHKNGRYFNQL